MSKVIIAGSRDFTSYSVLCSAMTECFGDESGLGEVVSGGARGADILGERWATEKNITLARFPAHWNTYGKSAGYIRNKQMAEYADILVALWDGESRGTKHMIDLARKEGLDVHIFNTTGDRL